MCNHEKTLEDVHTGDLICLDCSFVLEERLQSRNAFLSSGSTNSTNSRTWQAVIVKDAIVDVLAHPCLGLEDNQFICDTAYSIYSELCETSGPIQRIENRKLPRYYTKLFIITNEQCRSYLAYSIWEALNRQETPKSPHLIARVCDVLPSCILKVEKLYNRSSTNCSLASIVEGECSQMSVPFRITKLVRQISEKVEPLCYGRNPIIVFAGALHALVRKNRQDAICSSNKRGFKELDREEFLLLAICKRFATSCSTVKSVEKLVPDFEIDYENNIIVFKT